MCEDCTAICNAIGELNCDEGNSVTILAANPDFIGEDYAIEVCGEWTEWRDLRFGGRTVLAALESAIAEQTAKTCEHNWVDASNKVAQGGEMCTKCFGLRPTST